MTTLYVRRITFACPIAMKDDGNVFMACIANNAGDATSYETPNFVDAEGNEYAVASASAKVEYDEAMHKELVLPHDGQDMDLEAGKRIQALLDMEGPATPETFAVRSNPSWYPIDDQLWELGLTRI